VIIYILHIPIYKLFLNKNLNFIYSSVFVSVDMAFCIEFRFFGSFFMTIGLTMMFECTIY